MNRFKTYGNTDFQGLKVVIENKVGSIRRWKDQKGNKGETKMFYPYGYIKGTLGVDGDEVDCFIGSKKQSTKVFVIHSKNPYTDKYDEDKVMLGFETAEQARDAFLAHYENHEFLKDLDEMSLQEFKTKLESRKGKMIKSIISLFGKAVKIKDMLTMNMFDEPADDNKVVEGKTVIKNGKEYEYKRSTKDPNIHRLFAKQDSLFDEPSEDLIKQDVKNTPVPKVERKEKKNVKLFGQDMDLFSQPEPKEFTPKVNKNTDLEKIEQTAKQYGWTAKQNDKGDYDLSNRLGKHVATVNINGNKYTVTHENGEKLLSGNDEIGKGLDKVIAGYFYGEKVKTAEKPKVEPEIAETPQKEDLKPENIEQEATSKEESVISVFGAEGIDKNIVKTRKEINAKALELLSQDPETYTLDDLKTLAQYSGRGGLGGDTVDDVSLNEFYTRSQEANFMWDTLKKLGFKGGRVLEPSSGVGVFLGTAPEDTLMTGVEMEAVSGRIAEILHGKNHEIKIMPFEEHVKDGEGGQFDAVIGNCPFGKRGDTVMIDPEKSDVKTCEQYFVDRGIDELKEGGLMAMIVPTGIMDNKINQYRLDINKKAEFLGAVRMPTGAFKHAKAQVTTDIVFFRKRPQQATDYLNNLPAEQLNSAYDSQILDADFISGKYFDNNPQYAIGEKVKGNFNTNIWKGEVSRDDLDSVGEILKYGQEDYTKIGLDLQNAPEQKLNVGDVKTINGRNYRLNENHRWERIAQEDMPDTLSDEHKELFGVETQAELTAIKNDVTRHLDLRRDQLTALDDKYSKVLNSYTDKTAYKDDLLKQAVVLGLAIKDFQIKLAKGDIRGSEAQVKATQLAGLLEQFSETYGTPQELRLDKYLGKSTDNPILYFLGSYKRDGELSKMYEDPNGYNKVYRTNYEVGKLDRDDVKSVLQYLVDNDLDCSLGSIESMYNGVITEEDLIANPDVYMDEKGGFAPLNEVCVGKVYEKLDKWKQMIKELDGKLADPEISDEDRDLYQKKRNKLDEQNYALRERAGHKELTDLPVLMRDAGNYFDISVLNEYVEQNLGANFIGKMKYDENNNMFTFDDEQYHEMYMLYINKGGGNEKEDTANLNRSMKKYFDKEINPISFMLLNYINGLKQSQHGEKGKERLAKFQEMEQNFKSFLMQADSADEVTEAYNRAYNDFVQKEYSSDVIELSKFDFDKVVDVDKNGKEYTVRDKIGGHVWQAVRRQFEQGKGMVAHGVGLGKAQDLDSLVLTVDGYVRLGDVYEGQKIINSQGGISHITGIYPQGELDAYEVLFNDGSKVICNDEHLWAVRTEKQQAKNKPFEVKTLREIMPNIVIGKHKHLNYRVPMIQAVKFESKLTKIDPYLLGLLLGNGGLTHSVKIDFNPLDLDLVEYCENIAPKFGVSINKEAGENTSYSFTQKNKNMSKPNLLKDILRSYGIFGKKSEDKHIPSDYLINDIETRLSILQGLLDTDGYVSEDGMTVQFTSVSKQLIDAVKFIVNSLGGVVREHSKIGSYRKDGVLIECQLAYTLTVSMPPAFIPFRSKRKLARYIPKTKYQPIRLIKSVTYIGKREMQCIMVDSSDHLYATNDMVLTHNTVTAIALACLSKETGRCNKPLIVMPKSLQTNWLNEIGKWTKDAKVLVVGKEQDKNGVWKDVDSQKTKLHLQMIKNEDWDFILMTRDDFGRIDFSPETKKTMIKELSDKYYPEPTKREGQSDNALKKAKMKRQSLIQGLAETMVIDDAFDGVTLDNLGVDMFVRDEAHDVKNMLAPLNSEMKGIGNATSQRAVHNFFASKIIRGNNNDKGIFMLTATPISNSPIEVFNMMLPFSETELEQKGIKNIDDFIDRFARKESRITSEPDGTIVSKEVFRGWKSQDVLNKTFYRFTDYKTSDDVESVKANIKFPKEKMQKILSNLNAGQKELMNHCRTRLLTLKYRSREGDTWTIDSARINSDKENGLITSEMAQATLNYFHTEYLPTFIRLNQGRSPDKNELDDCYFSIQSDMLKIASDLDWYDEKNSLFAKQIKDKAFLEQNKDVEKFKQQLDISTGIYNSGGKQLIFAINTKLHGNIKDSLIKAGIKPSEIAIVNGKTAKKSEQRQAFSEGFNSGKYKVIIGNYATMGEGLNFNKMCSDIIHMQPTWNYAQIEQGNGRGIRQGNDLDFVNTHYMLTRGSIDTFMTDKTLKKGAMVEQFLRGKTAEWEDDTEMDAEQMLIELADNPEQAKKLSDMRNEKLASAQKESKRLGGYKKFDQLFDLKARMSKAVDRGSKKFQMMQQEHDKLMNELNNSDSFDHKQHLTLTQKPIVLAKKNIMIPVGSVIKLGGNDEYADTEYAVINEYTPTTGRINITRYKDDRVMNQVTNLTSVSKAFDDNSYSVSSKDISKMFNHFIEDGSTSAELIYSMPKEVLDGHRTSIINNLRTRNGEYTQTMYKNADGKIKFEYAKNVFKDLDANGGRILFPQDVPDFFKTMKQLAIDEQGGEAMNYARTLMGQEWKKAITKEIRKQSGKGEGVEISMKKADMIKKMNELSKKGIVADYQLKNFEKEINGRYQYWAHRNYFDALKDEFLHDYENTADKDKFLADNQDRMNSIDDNIDRDSDKIITKLSTNEESEVA